MLHASAAHSIRITVSDSGTWRTPRADEEIDRGRGLPMMNALMPGTRVVSGTDVTLSLVDLELSAASLLQALAELVAVPGGLGEHREQQAIQVSSHQVGRHRRP